MDVLGALRARFDFVEEYIQFLLGTCIPLGILNKIKNMNIAVIGGSSCSNKSYKLAQETGALIAKEGWALVCGGLSGVMEAACRGAKSADGLTIGILPGNDPKDANKYVDIKIPTGLGYVRNILVVRSSQAVIAIAGKYGTLSEISFALIEKKPVIGIGTWDIQGIIKVKTPQEAISYIKKFTEK